MRGRFLKTQPWQLGDSVLMSTSFKHNFMSLHHPIMYLGLVSMPLDLFHQVSLNGFMKKVVTHNRMIIGPKLKNR